MNTMMLALLQGRLWDTAASLQQRLQARDGEGEDDALSRELSQVLHALEAVQAGRYGYCSSCAEALEPDELLRRPYRLLCVHCDASRVKPDRSTNRTETLDAYTVEAWKLPASTLRSSPHAPTRSAH